MLKPNGSLAYLNGDSLIRADRPAPARSTRDPASTGSLAARGNRLYWIKNQITRVASFR